MFIVALWATEPKLGILMSIAIKICGITNERDLSVVCEEGADYFGMVLYEKSPRYISVKEASRLVKATAGVRIVPVGVTVDAAAEEILQLREETGITSFQLHGNESPEVVSKLKACGIVVIKAIRIGEGLTEPDWSGYEPDFFLCDTLAKNALGGTGQPWDPQWLPQHFPVGRTFIAGGLTPDNVDLVVRALSPFGVDVSSGVECSPGKKDHAKLRAFIRQVRRQ